MALNSDSVGALGEDVVGVLFGRKIEKKFRFLPQSLGAKFELFDFIVQLLDDTEHPYGPYFFLQVKSTCDCHDNASVSAPFSAEEVRRALGRRAPVYLVGVYIPEDGEPEEVFALAVDSNLTKGISVVPRHFSLREKDVRMAIFAEVHSYFESPGSSFSSKLSRATHAAKANAI